MSRFLSKREHLIQRLLEILPGFVSWNIILLPYWGVFVFPNLVAYFVLGFNIYWFYQSAQIAVTSFVSHLRIQASMNYDWVGDLKNFPDAKKIRNVIIIPTYKEPIHILRRTFNSIKAQTLPTKQIIVVLAMEKKEPEEDRLKKVSELKKEFANLFGGFYVTVHTLASDEVVGKASNERFAAIWFKKNVIDKKALNIDYFTITSCDADHKYHPNHFATLTYKFLDNPQR
jgi:cellulose synthase/poly-beta-1,6-N-acetylglucosamine synthase-like glycosyltransferase